MANRATRAEAANQRTRVTIHTQDTDAPILPIVQIEKLHEFRPDLVDFVFKQTEQEATHRRQLEKRRDVFVFIERILGQLLSVILAVLGIGGSIYAGLHGLTTLAIAIVGATIGTLAAALVAKNIKDRSN